MSTRPYNYKTIAAKMKSATKRVAILSAISSGMHGEALYGFRRYNELAEQPFKIYPYYSLSPDPLHVEIAARKILEQNFDLVVCIGTMSSDILHFLSKDKDNPPPIIFCFTGNPVERGLISSMKSSGNHLVGIEHYTPFIQPSIASFIKMYRGDGRVFIPYDSHPPSNRHFDRARTLIHEYMDRVIKQFHANGISAEAMGFGDPESTLDYIAQHASQFDTIFIPSSSYAINIHAPIGHYCEKNGTILCANLRSAVRCSAAYGFAESFITTGAEVAKYAQKILFDGVKPSDLPTKRLPDNRTVMINREVAQKQGLDPEKLIKRAGKDVVIFDKRAPFPAQYSQDPAACDEV